MILQTKENLQLQVSEIMDKDPAILDLSTSIIEAAKLMRNRGISSVLVSDPQSGIIKGIVTERDILYRVVAEAVGIFKVNIGKIMSSPLITVGKKTSCLDAILLMRKKGMRRLPVIDDDGKTVGIVTLMSLAGNTPIGSIDLAELEMPSSHSRGIIKCPHCQSEFNDKSQLSLHIDRIHLGSGLLGDLRNWE